MAKEATGINRPSELKTVYSNLVRISHSPADFVMDFAHLLPGATEATVNALVLFSPISAKLFLQALTDNVERYEEAFGTIDVPTGTSSLGAITYTIPSDRHRKN